RQIVVAIVDWVDFLRHSIQELWSKRLDHLKSVIVYQDLIDRNLPLPIPFDREFVVGSPFRGIDEADHDGGSDGQCEEIPGDPAEALPAQMKIKDRKSTRLNSS